MPDRHRLEPTPAREDLSPADRDSRVEWLLLTGLDHYFAAEYERAISAWTRVLFIDRGHARAKAYIDRARGAIAERQRQSEELLQRGVAAFDRGETERARALLTSAVDQGGPQEVALAFLERLERLERPVPVVEARVDMAPLRRRTREPRVPGEHRRVRPWTLPVVILAIVGVGAVYLLASRERTAPFLFLMEGSGPEVMGASSVPVEPLPVPRAAELDLERARALLASGHPRDALRLVERVRRGDPLRAEADELRAGIQAALLSGSDESAAPPRAAPASGVSRNP